MKKTILILLMIFFGFNYLYSQKSEDSTPFYYSLRQSKTPYKFGVEVGEDVNDGALFSLTFIKGKSPSYLINSAFILGLLDEDEKNGYNSYEAFFQWNRNTFLDEEQNNLSTGVIFNFHKIRKDEKKFYLPVTFIGNYYKDFQLKHDAFQFALGMSIIEIDKWITGGPENRKIPQINDKGLFGFLTLNLGIEYDYRFNSENSDMDGNFLRGFMYSKASRKFGKKEKFEVYINYEYRYSFLNTIDFYSKNMHYLDTGIDYSFENVRGFTPAIGLKYVNGQDPTQGFLDQSYLALNFTLKR